MVYKVITSGMFVFKIGKKIHITKQLPIIETLLLQNISNSSIQNLN